MHVDFFLTTWRLLPTRVVAAGAGRFEHQPNAAQCLVFADPAGHPFCLTLIDEVS